MASCQMLCSINRLILFSSLTLLSVCNASAKLWESKAELDARYGQPIRVEDHVVGKTYVYNFKRFTVLVTLLDGKSQSELYSRSDGKYLVPIEVINLLNLNTIPNHNWEPTDGMFGLVDSVRKGRPVAVAARSPDSAYPRTFHFCTAEFVKKFGISPAKTKTDQN